MPFISKTVRDVTTSGKFCTSGYKGLKKPNTSEKVILFQFLAAMVNFGRNGKCLLSRKT